MPLLVRKDGSMSMNDSSIGDLIADLKKGESKLAQRCRDDPSFYYTTVKMAEALEDFYQQTDDDRDALQSFERKLRRWVRASPDSYIGFWGELHAAYWLSQHEVPHCFTDEAQESQSPDLALEVIGKTVYFEVKTLQENQYEWFAAKVLEEIGSFLPDRGIGVRKLRLAEGKEETLVTKAVELIRDDWLPAPYSPVEYEGNEGEFSIVLPKGGGVKSSWSDSRVRQDGTPWLESQLETVLRDNIGQFQGDAPTFLIWVSFDMLLPGFKAHVLRVLQQSGPKFAEVAGIVVLAPFLEWDLSQNKSYHNYEELKQEGLFDAIRDFRHR